MTKKSPGLIAPNTKSQTVCAVLDCDEGRRRHMKFWTNLAENYQHGHYLNVGEDFLYILERLRWCQW